LLFLVFCNTGYGLVAAMLVVGLLKKTVRPVSDLCRVFEPVPQILENVCFNAGVPLENDEVIAAIRAGEQKLGNSGRLVIRPSGTEPLIRVMGEGDDAVLVQNVVAEIVGTIQSVAA
jgi:phosphoglucosamine mutase